MNMNLGDTRLIIKECKKYGCLRNQAAYILATAYWETARKMKPVVEAFWKSEDWRKANLRYYPWHGRGYVQLTWERNYRKAQSETGYPVFDKPETALDPEPAAAILVKGSMEGWFTGKRLVDFITLQKSDFYRARKVINGMDKASEIAKLAKEYDAELKAEGYGEENVIPLPKAKPQSAPKPKNDKPLTKSRTVGGGTTAGVGTLGTVASEMADKIEPIIHISPYLKAAFVILTLIGIAVVFYARWDDGGRPKGRAIFG